MATYQESTNTEKKIRLYHVYVKLYKVEKIKFKEAVVERNIKRPGPDGNCPKCGFDQIKFVDGISYKCTQCGEVY